MSRFTIFTVFALAGLAIAAPSPDAEPTPFLAERALPSGHPVIDNSFLSENGLATGYTIKTNIYPSGFIAPTEPITALPSGYSVAYNGVFDPSGQTVSAFPSSALEAVIAKASSTSNPGAPEGTATSPASSTPSASATAEGSNGAGVVKPSIALALVGIVMTLMA